MRGLSPFRLALAVLAVLLPWSWFLLRDVFGSVGDVIAIIWPAAALLTAGTLAIAGIRWRLLWVAAASTALMAAVAIVSPWVPADAGSVVVGRGIAVVGANVDSGSEALDALLARQADVLVVSEVSQELDRSLSRLYPHHYAETKAGPRVGVYSRLPFGPVTPSSADLPGMRIELAVPGGPVVLYALHVPRPWYVGSTERAFQATVAEHRRLIAEVARRAAAESGPVIVVGDLNASDRSSDYRVLLRQGQLVDAMRSGPVGPTSSGKWSPLLLRIDHLLVKPGWCGDSSQSFVLPASSHLGISATVGPCQP